VTLDEIARETRNPSFVRWAAQFDGDIVRAFEAATDFRHLMVIATALASKVSSPALKTRVSEAMRDFLAATATREDGQFFRALSSLRAECDQFRRSVPIEALVAEVRRAG
jgi:hypothetical protein